MIPARRLCKICDGYPVSTVTDAIRLALVEEVADEGERTQIAALVVHWLSAPDEGLFPPVSDAVVDAVRRVLAARAH